MEQPNFIKKRGRCNLVVASLEQKCVIKSVGKYNKSVVTYPISQHPKIEMTMESAEPKILLPATVQEDSNEDHDSLVSGELSLSTDEGSSTTASARGSDSGGTNSKDEHAPEALVRKENQAVRITRLIVILILIDASRVCVAHSDANTQHD